MPSGESTSPAGGVLPATTFQPIKTTTTNTTNMMTTAVAGLMLFFTALIDSFHATLDTAGTSGPRKEHSEAARSGQTPGWSRVHSRSTRAGETPACRSGPRKYCWRPDCARAGGRRCSPRRETSVPAARACDREPRCFPPLYVVASLMHKGLQAGGGSGLLEAVVDHVQERHALFVLAHYLHEGV